MRAKNNYSKKKVPGGLSGVPTCKCGAKYAARHGFKSIRGEIYCSVCVRKKGYDPDIAGLHRLVRAKG